MANYKVEFIGTEELIELLEMNLEDDFGFIEEGEEADEETLQDYEEAKKAIEFLKKNFYGIEFDTMEEYKKILRQINTITDDYKTYNEGMVIVFY